MIALSILLATLSSPAEATPCSFDFDCGSASICEGGECIPGCRTDDDCASDEACSDGVCETLTPDELVAQQCPCDDTWSNHGQYVRCVVHAVEDLALDPAETDALIADAAVSDCGR